MGKTPSLESVTKVLLEEATPISDALIRTMRQTAAEIDSRHGVGNLGNNAVANALAHALDTIIADMSTYNSDRNHEKIFKEVHEKHQHSLHQIIAEHAQSGRSVLVDVRHLERHGNDGGGT